MIRRFIPVLLAVILVSVPTIIIATDTSDADNEISGVTIDTPLNFGKSSGKASADTINEKAGLTVCSYNNGNLTFSKSCTITLKSQTLSDLFVFDDSYPKQSLTVKQGSVLTLGIDTDCTDTPSNRYAFVHAKCSYFDIIGNGKLMMKPVHIDPAVSEYYDGISCVGDMTFSYADVNIAYGTSKLGCGIYDYGRDLSINNSTVTIYTALYGIYMNCGAASEMTWENCTIDITGCTACFNYTGDCTVHQNNITIKIPSYDRYNKNTYSTVSADTLKHCFNVQTYVNTPDESGNIWTIIIAILIFIAMIVIYKFGSDYKQARKIKKVAHRERIVRQQGDGYTEISSNDTDTLSYRIQVTKGNEKAMIYIDGIYYGMITDKVSFIDVPRGHHDILIRKCDRVNDIIYSQRLFLVRDGSITVSLSHDSSIVSVV